MLKIFNKPQLLNFQKNFIFCQRHIKKAGYDDKKSFEFISGSINNSKDELSSISKIYSHKYVDENEYNHICACAHFMYMTVSEYEEYCGLKSLVHKPKV